MKLFERLNQYAANQRAVRALNRLDGRQLADIGIERENIVAAVRGLNK